MEIRQLKSFQAVSLYLSFSRAAEHLNYAQSTISMQIQLLEADLGVRLFDRLGKTVMLTEAGERLLDYANKIIDLTNQTRSEISQTTKPQGSLSIRVPETLVTYCLPGVIKRFNNKFPDVRLAFTTCSHEGLAKDLRKGITDLAFLLTDSIQAADFINETLGFETLRIVASPRHRLGGREIIRMEDLGKETFLLSKVDCSYRKLFLKTLEENNIERPTIMEFNSTAAIKECVKNGMGLTVMPSFSVNDDILAGQLKELCWEEDHLEIAVMMIRYKDRWVSPALKAFTDTVLEEFH